jgi:hypothetical protein
MNQRAIAADFHLAMIHLFSMSGRCTGVFHAAVSRAMVRLATRVKALFIAVQRAAKIQQPHAEYPFHKSLEAAAGRPRQPRRIEGPDGLLNPEERLLLGVFKLPGDESTADGPGGDRS